MVRRVILCLRKVLGKGRFTFEECMTTLQGVEAVVNFRLTFRSHRRSRSHSLRRIVDGKTHGSDAITKDCGGAQLHKTECKQKWVH